ncbi:hypothetical protein Acr_00g0014140 [Actinidia rufa]|uniref:Galactose oxidase/kelch repeat superfamily protein n=1 Tax=Actinidia rufa TaxID=165716 RepID=A0A7J0DA87_9ERIC|nr:hypothetical protein Acr_00g0014140 [Actinidia rufa]
MVKGKEREMDEERENEEESKGFDEYYYRMNKNGGLDMDCDRNFWFGSGSPSPEKMRIRKTTSASDQITRDGSSEYWKLSLVNRRYSSLLKSGELFRIRREIGIKESSVFMAAIGENIWWAFDREFNSRRKLPILQTDICFVSADRESFCAARGVCLPLPLAGTYAFVAGGVGKDPEGEVYDTAEKYTPETKSWGTPPEDEEAEEALRGNMWVLIPEMLKDDPVKSCHSPPLVAVVNNELYSLETSSNQLKVYLKSSNTWRQLGDASVSSAGNRMAMFTCSPDPDANGLDWKLVNRRNQPNLFILNCSVMVA